MEKEFFVRFATISDLQIIIPLFIKYREFYNCVSSIENVETFLRERLINNQSTIFLCYFINHDNESNNENNKEIIVGFAQAFPSYNSITLKGLLILHDLFVSSEFRGKGIGSILLQTVKEYAINNNYDIQLETAKDNLIAQRLYESHEYQKEEQFITYFLKL